MRILITGGAGFIGSHVVEYYANKGYDIVAFDNLSRSEVLHSPGALYNWHYIESNLPSVKLVKGDVRHFDELKSASEDVNAIVHTAAQVAVTTSLTDPRMDFEVNALGTLNVAETARLKGATLISCSTNKVYGENVNSLSVVEKRTRYRFADPVYEGGIPERFNVDLTGHSPYGCSKLAADVYLQDYAHTYGLRTGVFRMSCIYGERQFGVEDQGWVSWFTIATLTCKPITIYGDGKQVRDVLYVRDLVNAFDRFLNSDLRHGVFNLGGGPQNTLSLLELLRLLKRLTGKMPKISFSPWRQSDQKVYVSDISQSLRLLNWKPVVTPKEGIVRLVEWVSGNIELFR